MVSWYIYGIMVYMYIIYTIYYLKCIYNINTIYYLKCNISYISR